MWHVLSFTGRFDETFFTNVKAPEKQPGERSTYQKDHTRNAALARTKLRHGEIYARKQDNGEELTPKQLAVARLYRDGTLLARSNELTLQSGHGSLRTADGAVLEIGGSTGGEARKILEAWTPPKPEDFLRQELPEDSGAPQPGVLRSGSPSAS